MSEEDATLDWHICRWQGITVDGELIWMEDATLHRQISAWLTRHGITEPTAAEQDKAFQDCRRLASYQDCTDPDVHIVSYQRALARQRRARGERDAP
jgi:hypothetical protein